MTAQYLIEQYDLEQHFRSGTDELYGLQWGDPLVTPHLVDVRQRFLEPYIYGANAVEIGCGGGRWSQFMLTAKNLLLIDGTPAAKMCVKRSLPHLAFDFAVCQDGMFDRHHVDFVFSFDTFVHFPRPLLVQYMDSIRRCLKVNGKASIHYARKQAGCETGPAFFYLADDDFFDIVTTAGLDIRASMDITRGLGSRMVLLEKK